MGVPNLPSKVVFNFDIDMTLDAIRNLQLRGRGLLIKVNSGLTNHGPFNPEIFKTAQAHTLEGFAS